MSERKPKSQRHVKAGQARHRRLLEQHGEEGYRAFQQAGHAAMKRKYGEAFAKACIAKAHETRRQWRIYHPTPGEVAVAVALVQRGYRIHEHPDAPFDYRAWHPDDGSGYTAYDVIREAKIGPYYADLALPVHALVIEIIGGIHCLTQARDATRRQWLEAQGLRVVLIDETTATTPEALAAVMDDLLGGGDATPADIEGWNVWRRYIDIIDDEVWNERIPRTGTYSRRVSYGDGPRCRLDRRSGV